LSWLLLTVVPTWGRSLELVINSSSSYLEVKIELFIINSCSYLGRSFELVIIISCSYLGAEP